MRKIKNIFPFVIILFFLFCFFFSSLSNAATVDVMVVYDSTAKAWADNNGGMNTFAADAIARMNQAATNSNVDVTFRLVYAAQVSYTYSGDLGIDLENLQAGAGNMAIVHQWRNKYGADLVVLLEDTGSAYGWVGVGYLLTSYSGNPDYAFTTSAIRSVDISHTLTHEVGHNLGAHHSKYQTQSPGPNSALNTYSAGWYFAGTNSTAYHTIMAYNDQDGDGYADHTEAPLFSTPLLSYQGTIAGHAADGDNSRTIRETMNVVAAYRPPASILLSHEGDSFSYSGTIPWDISITVTTSTPDIAWTATSNVSWISITSGASGTGNGTITYNVATNETGSNRMGIITVGEMVFTITQGSYPGVWPQKTDFGGTSRNWAVGFSIGSKGYIGTGYDSLNPGYTKDFWEYDPSSNTWTQKVDFGGTGRYNAVGFSIGNMGYIGTGTNGSSSFKDFWEYDPSSNTWTRKADFGGTERYGSIGFSIGSKGYIGTGYYYDGSQHYYKDFWEYDPATNTWIQKADFGGTGRDGAVGFSIGSKGYIGTGYDGSVKRDFWEYDPTINTWKVKTAFGGTSRSKATGFSIGGKGYIGTGMSEYADFWEYDPVLNTWFIVSPPPWTMGRHRVVGFSIGDKGYIGTGWQNYSPFNRKDFWEYIPGIISTITISPENADFGVSGGIGNITVTTSWSGVSWTAITYNSWITINSGASGTGSGTVTYSVAANETGLDRMGMIIVEGIEFIVTQAGDPTITLSPDSANIDISGGTGSITVTAASSGFSWTAMSNVTWIIITSGATGTGNGIITYSVSANGICSNTTRQGTITVAGAILTVTQLGNSVNCWTQKADFGGHSRGMAVGFSIGGKGYIGTGWGLGNTNDFWEYNPALNTWTKKANFVTTGLRYEAVGFSIGNKGYIGMGNDYSLNLLQKDFWEYDPALNTWAQKSNFGGTGRYAAVGFSIENKGYIGTGDDWNSLYADLWEYNPATDTWTQMVDLGWSWPSRVNAVGFSIGGKGYIGTGTDYSTVYKDFWEYDSSTNTWTQKADFGGTARYNAVGFSIGGKGYIGTGWGLGNTKDFWEYNPALNTWTQRAYFGEIERGDAVGFSIGNKGYIGTGSSGGSYKMDFWEYTPGVSPLFATFIGDGLYKWDGTTWTLGTHTSPASMVASNNAVYADFTGDGLYRWDGITWTLGTHTSPSSMVASSNAVYADFTGDGLYKWDGTTWTLGTHTSPASMVASSTAVYADFTGDGLYKWDGSTWTKLTSSHPASMVASGTSLYVDFAGDGLYEWDGSTWTKLTNSHPASMVASNTSLYADFAEYGLYEWNGITWTRLTNSHPANMVVSSTSLYADLAGNGLYEYNGSTWNKLTSSHPASMVASGTSLYADFAGDGLYQWDGITWTKLTTSHPASMAAGE